MGKTYFVYFMSNKSRRLYVGITSQLPLRGKNVLRLRTNTVHLRYRYGMTCDSTAPVGSEDNSPVRARAPRV